MNEFFKEFLELCKKHNVAWMSAFDGGNAVKINFNHIPGAYLFYYDDGKDTGTQPHFDVRYMEPPITIENKKVKGK